MIKRLLKLKYIFLLFLLIHISLVISATIHEETDRKSFLENQTQLSKIEYETVYAKTKEQSEIIFHEKINVDEIIDIFKKAHNSDSTNQDKLRKQLHDALSKSYTRLKDSINLRQLHFHLPNNHSFLRMHRPEKYGDDLTDIRPTVAFVNKNKKQIDGFEEGRVYNGFRFVYPLFSKDTNQKSTYIGSVEVSFSALSFQKTLSNNVRFSQFIFSKKIIDEKVWKSEYISNYIQAAIHPQFMLEPASFKDKFAPIKKQIIKNLSNKIINDFATNLEAKIAHSQVVKVDNETYILSFLPIINSISKELVGYIIILKKSIYLDHLHFQNIVLKFISFALLFSIFILIYIYKKHDDDIQEQKYLLLEQSKMAQMGSMLSNIAHQWKQPLAQINAKLIELPISLSLNEKNTNILDRKIEDIEEYTSYMAETIENFRRYFHPDKQKDYFNISDAIDKSLSLVEIESNIKVNVVSSKNLRLHSYENELIQVLIVLIINAKEALLQANVSDPNISIVLHKDASNIEIEIIDNAGGIEDKTIKQIFNPYFSTKHNNTNTGIGLYMAKMIIEGMQGTLLYKKHHDKSHFTIKLQGIESE
ncbi:ATP-binding protein [Sulfurimonas sp.]|nr:ATP-binding protein [Sulfurimonas sp.]